ncbi:hypothetical protein HMPREF9294_0149 [Porphyromonas asaccharolytica PR426713P-I]|nr:hypothetical protein HMPREF9294_0149 [Porphyromonas asaccharolytica PR426713P-I]
MIEIDKMFQFTHPVRGATCPAKWGEQNRQCFNSRTPCGVRQQMQQQGQKLF